MQEKMDRRLIILLAITGFAMIFISFPDGALSVLLIMALAIPSAAMMRKLPEKGGFLVNVFFIGLLLRLWLGILIEMFQLRDLFGPDAYTYDNLGFRLLEIWRGINVPNDMRTQLALSPTNTGWGMIRVVAVLYAIFGQSVFVAQSFCAVFGALTAPLVYFCAEQIFNNKKVAKVSSMAIAVFPSFVIWSSQLLKDGLIVFLLVCTMVLVLQLQKKLNYLYIVLLVFAVFGVYVMRFYIFYMLAISVVGSFFIGSGTTVKTMSRNIVIVMILGIALTYLGILRSASENFETYTDLQKIQLSRQDLAVSAESGFGEDVDVSTFGGLIAAIPIGLVYLMFSPFPWEATKLSQIMVLPETLIWWGLIPIMISGLAYTVRHRFRAAIPIIIFSLMLTLSYSIFQGNVGMLYRQRIQIQVFLFMFISVGWALISERKENKKLLIQAKNQEIERRLRLNMER